MVLEVFDVATSNAQKIIDLHQKKEQGNCKFLAERIASYNSASQKNSIIGVIDNMSKFFNKAYGGLYCGLCNGDNQKYFNTE